MQSTMRVFTAADQDRLRQFISAQQARLARESDALELFRRRVEEGEVVSSDQVSSDVVTLYSQVRVQDVDNGRSFVLTVALPSGLEAYGASTSLQAYPTVDFIGARVGDELEWRSVDGQRRTRVEEILFQPEASPSHSRGHAPRAGPRATDSVSLPCETQRWPVQSRPSQG